MAGVAVGERVEVRGRAPELAVHLRAWCRAQGHGYHWPYVVRGGAQGAHRRGAEPAGGPATVADRPPATWGLAARGALVEAGGPEFPFALDEKEAVWTGAAAGIYRQALAAQWDPAVAVDWDEPFDLPEEVEAAVVQVMTYLIENENAALVVPARFLGQIHPHFREVVAVLAAQVADEARHVEVFTRRAELKGVPLGLSTAGGQASLLTLLEEPDFPLAHFLLSVLGEGTFLSLLSFLERWAPDPVTRRITHLALADEARHVAFGMAHLGAVLASDPGLRPRLAATVRRRHDALASTAGLNGEVFDALVVLAAGSFTPAAIADGFAKVQALETDMDDGRRRRLTKLGFDQDEASELAELHTKNFM
ncbi:MAG TPA: ferritin-like domain-containing protein [Acidimicrobiales bacterium]|nr:ferritin-like domain-containing protein [Acidimicrobiales bacterium]